MTPPPVSAARDLRRAIRGALLRRAAWTSLAAGLLLAGASFFALRIALPSLSPWRLLPWAAAPVALLFAALAIPALRRVPSPAQCLAAVESATRAGGLALCAQMPGAEAWAAAAPAAVAPSVRFRPSPALAAALPLAAAFCALSLALPARLFETILPPPPDPTGVLSLAEREEERLEGLLDAGALDEAAAAELREWLDQVRAGAENGSSSQAALLEALDHVARKLDDAALAAASGAVAEQNALLAADAVASALADAAALADARAAEGAPDALAALQSALPLSAGAKQTLAEALPGGAAPLRADDLPASLPAPLREKLADLLPKLSASQLRDFASALAASAAAGPADAPSADALRAADRLLRSLDPELLADVADALASIPPEAVADLDAEKLAALCGACAGLPGEFLEKLAALLAKVPPDVLRRYAEALRAARGDRAGGGANAGALSPEDILALCDLLDELSPEDFERLANLFSKLDPEGFEKLVSGGGACAGGGAPQVMTPEQFRAYLEKLRALSNLSSNELARLKQGNPGCCGSPKLAPLPSPSAALDALLAQHSAAAAAAAAALGLCTGTGPDGDGGPPAPLGFTGDTAPVGPDAFHDAPLQNGAGAPDPATGVLLGVSAGDPEAGDAAAPVSAGALDPAASSPDDAGATRAAPVLPRHQKTIESYFGDEP